LTTTYVGNLDKNNVLLYIIFHNSTGGKFEINFRCYIKLHFIVARVGSSDVDLHGYVCFLIMAEVCIVRDRDV